MYDLPGLPIVKSKTIQTLVNDGGGTEAFAKATAPGNE